MKKSSQAFRQSRIPSPDAAGALSVTDGSTFVGKIVKQDGAFFAFDVRGTLLGEYPTRVKR